MAAGLPPVTPRRMERILFAKGFVVVAHRGKGSHRICAHPETGQRTMISFHSKDLPKGTLHTIMRHAGLTVNDLTE